MTWPEGKQALADGRTTVLIFRDAAERRGRQGVNGPHRPIMRVLGVGIARKLGNAILAPVVPRSVKQRKRRTPARQSTPEAGKHVAEAEMKIERGVNQIWLRLIDPPPAVTTAEKQF